MSEDWKIDALQRDLAEFICLECDMKNLNDKKQPRFICLEDDMKEVNDKEQPDKGTSDGKKASDKYNILKDGSTAPQGINNDSFKKVHDQLHETEEIINSYSVDAIKEQQTINENINLMCSCKFDLISKEVEVIHEKVNNIANTTMILFEEFNNLKNNVSSSQDHNSDKHDDAFLRYNLDIINNGSQKKSDRDRSMKELVDVRAKGEIISRILKNNGRHSKELTTSKTSENIFKQISGSTEQTRRMKNSINATSINNLDNNNCRLTKEEKSALFISRIKNEIDTLSFKGMLDYIMESNNITSHDLTVTRLKTRYSTYNSYHIEGSICYINVIKNSNLWPYYTLIKQFEGKLSKHIIYENNHSKYSRIFKNSSNNFSEGSTGEALRDFVDGSKMKGFLSQKDLVTPNSEETKYDLMNFNSEEIENDLVDFDSPEMRNSNEPEVLISGFIYSPLIHVIKRNIDEVVEEQEVETDRETERVRDTVRTDDDSSRIQNISTGLKNRDIAVKNFENIKSLKNIDISDIGSCSDINPRTTNQISDQHIKTTRSGRPVKVPKKDV